MYLPLSLYTHTHTHTRRFERCANNTHTHTHNKPRAARRATTTSSHRDCFAAWSEGGGEKHDRALGAAHAMLRDATGVRARRGRALTRAARETPNTPSTETTRRWKYVEAKQRVAHRGRAWGTSARRCNKTRARSRRREARGARTAIWRRRGAKSRDARALHRRARVDLARRCARWRSARRGGGDAARGAVVVWARPRRTLWQVM